MAGSGAKRGGNACETATSHGVISSPAQRFRGSPSSPSPPRQFAPRKQPPTPSPDIPTALPPACSLPLAADKMANVAAFIWAGCPQLLKWPHDKAVRMSGPAPSGTASVHGYVLNYYAPSVYSWPKAGRPAGGIPDGAVILKQMYADHGGVIGAPSGWALIVKQKSASFDGWFCGWTDPTQPSGAAGGYGNQFYDPNCVACHGSASTREVTFASLDNIAIPSAAPRCRSPTALF